MAGGAQGDPPGNDQPPVVVFELVPAGLAYTSWLSFTLRGLRLKHSMREALFTKATSKRQTCQAFRHSCTCAQKRPMTAPQSNKEHAFCFTVSKA